MEDMIMRTSSGNQLLSARDTALSFQQTNHRVAVNQIAIKWERKIFGQVRLEEPTLDVPHEEERGLRIEFDRDLENAYSGLLEYYTSPIPDSEKKSVIQITQRLLIRFLDKMALALQSQDASSDKNAFFLLLNEKFSDYLKLIEELFVHEFDDEAKVPIILLNERKRGLSQIFQQILFLFSDKDEATTGICHTLFKTIEAFFSNNVEVVRFKDLSYYRELLNDLVQVADHLSFHAVQEFLYYHNYNHEIFVEFECERLLGQLNLCANDKQRIAVLKREQKSINQFPEKLNHGYSDNFPPLKQQVNNWISEEVKYLESGYAQHSIENHSEGSGERIQTSLSVAKLAVIIRLLVIDKIIINRSVAPMLRIVAGVFTTLQRDAISVGSLEAKYHAPDKATVNTVRDMLFKWINILGKL